MKNLTFNQFDLIIVEDNQDKTRKIIWKKNYQMMNLIL
jgi:hypothetical protein